MNTNPTDPEATPDFDEWGWDSYWTAEDWITWLVALREKYGKPVAADKFAAAWNSRTGWIESFGDVRGDWLSFNSPFRKELNKYELSNGMNLLDVLETSSPASSVIGGGSDVVNATGGGLTNIAGGLSGTTNTLKYLLPILVVIVAITVLVKFNFINLKIK